MGNGIGVKRYGTNVYKKSEEDVVEGKISLEGVNKGFSTPDGKNASISSGDSGGPLFVENKGIVGIVSRNFHNF